MKTLKLIQLALIIVILFNANLFSQVVFEASVTGPKFVPADPNYGNCVYFDIYLRQSDGHEPLYLADADFKFTFFVVNFTAPKFEFVPGTSQLYNSLGSFISTYESGITSSFIDPNVLSISVQPPAFSTQTQFNQRVAMIDATPLKHKLGTFVVYTALPQESMGLTWKTETGGTVVTSFESTSPWQSSEAKVSALLYSGQKK